jgi:hypothetical protein
MTIPALPQTSASLSKERIEKALKSPPSELSNEMKSLRAKLDKIEEKNKCLRVQFLDWLSDKLLNWSNRCHEMSVRIDSPCVIKIEPRKREESQHAKESKEITRLRELLKEERERNKK